MPRPCLPGHHVWVEQVGHKGSRYTICDVCNTPRDPKED